MTQAARDYPRRYAPRKSLAPARYSGITPEEPVKHPAAQCLWLVMAILAISCAPGEPQAPAPEDRVDAAPDPWPLVEDPRDLRRIRELRDTWVDAFSKGDASRLGFIFDRDAVFQDLAALTGKDRPLSSARLFDRFTAELILGRERPVEYGEWVSYHAEYCLSLDPTDGGTPVEEIGRFMVVLDRGDDGRLEVVTGPRVGEPAPGFALSTADGTRTVRLEDLRGKPTVLLFGSFT